MDKNNDIDCLERAKSAVCAIIPAYQEALYVGDTVRRAREFVKDVFVVDDGSTDGTAQEAAAAGAMVVRHERNRGKGVALNTGFQHVSARGFNIVITLDADGQHDPSDIPRFIDAFVRTGIPVLVGNRIAHSAAIPPLRRVVNRVMSYMLSRQMGQYLPDTQCGFRLYRCDVIPFVLARSERYAAESEILLHVAARDIRMDSIPITVVRSRAKNHVNPFMDAIRFFLMLARYRSRSRWRHAEQDQGPDEALG